MPILLLEASRPMMFGLILDVLDRFRHLGNANAEGAITLLPTKVSHFPIRLVNPG
jgi:hypothetical protein